MQGTKLRSVRAGGDERMPWDALVGQVAADRIGYAGEEFCSRSPPNFSSVEGWFPPRPVVFFVWSSLFDRSTILTLTERGIGNTEGVLD